MAFDSATREKLRRMVNACRRLLTDEFDDQLQGLYGIYAQDGRMLELEKLTTLDDDHYQIATLLRDRVAHLSSGIASEKNALAEAVRRVLREQAFTLLNRFAALRIAEERGFVQECVGQGLKSRGFQVFETVARSGLGDAFNRYVTFIYGMYDELSLDLGVLFDRWSPFGLLFPREPALLKFFDLVNDPELKALWKEDETIGWIYQYFNGNDVKEMREAAKGGAPRNSRELAVRNQFFTPRYVVEFLTDNTLGRIWYEMSGGRTALKEKCRYLVRRPTEVFLAAPEEVYRHLFNRDADAVDLKPNEWVTEAFGGVLKNLKENPSDPDTRWVAGAIRPADFESLAGKPCPSFEDHRLSRLVTAIIDGRENEDTHNVVLVWAALSDFARCDGSRGYSSPDWDKLWAHFYKLAHHPAAENLSQEELLKQPVFIPHRSIKDPRTILVLDPACGSMHFGLYAFDLFEVIYEEAWELEKLCDAVFENRPPGMLSLHETYGTKEDFLKDVPRLIIEHNLNGIDIDPRCAQIAGLSLWLRAQKTWQRLSLKPAERPVIRRSNIVCAEPMPGEKELLREFVEREFPAAERGVFLQLLEAIFDKMQLAGEAGSLLKIEEEIRSAIEEARAAWEKLQNRPQELFSTAALNAISQQTELDATSDLRLLTEDFFERVEERIYTALRDYAEQAENGGGFQRRLFAEDAAQGFAFIDVCCKHYDVALMNPPFGFFPPRSDYYLNLNYGDCYGDFYPAFIKRWTSASEILGAITNRTGLAVQSLEDWRRATLLGNSRLVVLGDLGIGVLDALVETAMYVISRADHEIVCAFGMLDIQKHKVEDSLLTACKAVQEGVGNGSTYLRALNLFRNLPRAPIAYRLPQSITKCFASSSSLEKDEFVFRTTNSTNDSFRFLRLRWEVPLVQDKVTSSRKWIPLSKGGEYQPFFTDLELMICWDSALGTYHGYVGSVHRPLVRPACADLFFQPGITWSERTASRFSPRVLPAGAIFTNVGPYAGGGSPSDVLVNLGIMMSAPYQALFDLFLAAGDATSSGAAARHYQVGELRLVPNPKLSSKHRGLVESNIRQVVDILQKRFVPDERSSWFDPRAWRIGGNGGIKGILARQTEDYIAGVYAILSATLEIDRAIADGYQMAADDTSYVERCFGKHPLEYDSPLPPSSELEAIFAMETDQLIRKAVDEGIGGRFITVKSYYADRHLEVAAHYLKVSAAHFKDLLFQRENTDANEKRLAAQIFSLCVGVALGRWDLQILAEPHESNGSSPDPFEPLPFAPPVMRLSAQQVNSMSKDECDFAYHGILVDDATDSRDLTRRIYEILDGLWAKEHSIQDELQHLLTRQGDDLRTWLRKGFFEFHLSQYSDSQRTAPIYWPLSTASGGYTLWIYYHRLTDQTLFQCVNDFVRPKLDEVTRDMERLRGELQRSEGGNSKQREELEKLEDFANEIKEFHDELLRVAGLPYKPNLNDGVLINASPLWKLFRLPKWQKDLKACWEALEGEEYEWAHLAYTIWPDRVKQACKKDRSIAIAHGLEALCEVKTPEKKAKRGKKSEQMQLKEGDND